MPFKVAYSTPAAPSTIQPRSSAARKAPAGGLFSRGAWGIGLILAFGFSAAALRAADPPENLAKLVAQRETETEAERNEYMYRQAVTLDELDEKGSLRGQYKETRDVIFSPKHERTEEMVGAAQNSLKQLILTPEDFHDIREIQPLVLTTDTLWNYETRFRGEEIVEDIDCWVLQVRPRQILSNLRYFDGVIWVDQKEHNIVRMEGRAVPEIRSMKSENLFPRFTTIRKPIDGKHWFPVMTYADDTLHFRNGAVRERLRILYSNYRRFGAESTFTPK